MRPAALVACAAALLLVAMAGYRQGTVSIEATGLAPTTAERAALPQTPTHRSTPPRTAEPVLPAKLGDLDGKAYIAALPELERRARGGDEVATRLLVERAQQCSGSAPQDEDAIRQQVEEDYQRQLEIQTKFPMPNPPFVIDQKWHDDRLREALDARDRCVALSAEKKGERFAWAALALSRHDRAAVLQFTFNHGLYPDSTERVRYVDQLIDLADQESVELNRLVEAGDVDAMGRAVQMLSHHDFTLFDDNDPARAYAIADALMLDGDPGTWKVNRLMEGLEKTLSPDQLEFAQKAGQALYQRCCAAGQAAGSH